MIGTPNHSARAGTAIVLCLFVAGCTAATAPQSRKLETYRRVAKLAPAVAPSELLDLLRIGNFHEVARHFHVPKGLPQGREAYRNATVKMLAAIRNEFGAFDVAERVIDAQYYLVRVNPPDYRTCAFAEAIYRVHYEKAGPGVLEISFCRLGDVVDIVNADTVAITLGETGELAAIAFGLEPNQPGARARVVEMSAKLFLEMGIAPDHETALRMAEQGIPKQPTVAR